MWKPEVTITLGRSGQKVVKRSCPASGTTSQALSGTKRYMSDEFERVADTSMASSSKPLRRKDFPRNSGSTGVRGAQVGRNDLRLKLMRKRESRQIKLDVEERTKTEIHQSTSSTIWVPKGEKHSLRIGSPTKTEGRLLMIDPLRSYSSRPLDNGRPQSSDRVFHARRRKLPTRNTDEEQRVPSTMLGYASGTRSLSNSDIEHPSLSIDPSPITRKVPIDVDKPLAENFSGQQPLNVSILLHSLGLGKYAINFLAQEVDLTALKQMKDNDLKALGLPMGPRKKILLAIMPRPKREQ